MKQHAVIINEDQLRQFLIYWKRVKLPDEGYYVEWEPKADRRSSDQNKLLWVGAYRPIAEHLSEQSGKIITSEHVHAVAKDRFLDPVVVELNGKSKSYPGSTTKLKKAEFGDYLEKVWSWGAEMGVWFQ